MTVVVIRNAAARSYLGLSSDTKPTPAAGARFFETDTGRLYVADGSAWGLGSLSGANHSILEELWPSG